MVAGTDAPVLVAEGRRGVGGGNTTPLAALAANGHRRGPELARTIIRLRFAAGLPPRPEPEKFARRIFERDLRNYEERDQSFEEGIRVFDGLRPVFDGLRDWDEACGCDGVEVPPGSMAKRVEFRLSATRPSPIMN